MRSRPAPGRVVAAAAVLAPLCAQSMLSGRVVDPHGEPVAAASVWLVSAFAPEQRLLTARSDADGRFAVPLPDTAAALQLCAATAGSSIARKPVPCHHRAEQIAFELRLEDGAPLRGKVIDAAGNAIAGAAVLAAHDWWSAGIAPACDRAVTGADGSFALAHAPLGRIQLRVVACSSAVATAAVTTPTRTPVLVVLAPSPPATQVLVFGVPAGALAAARWLLTGRAHGEGLRLFRRPATAPGLLELPVPRGLAAVDCTLPLPSLAGHEVLVALDADDLLFDDRPGSGAVLGHQRDNCVQTGRLLDAVGQPLAGERLLAWDDQRPRPRAEVVTAADGGFTWRGAFSPYASVLVALPPERDLVLAPSPTSPATADAIGATPVRVPLPLTLRALPAASVHGRALGPRGAALAGADVELQTTAGQFVAATTTRADGSFRITGLGADGAALRVVLAAAGLHAGSAPFELRSARTTFLPDLVAAPWQRLCGTLTAADGRPAAGWRLIAWPWSRATGRAEDAPTMVVTDRAGRFTFWLPAGCHRLLPEDELGDWHWLCPPIDVVDGATRPLSLRLDRD